MYLYHINCLPKLAHPYLILNKLIIIMALVTYKSEKLEQKHIFVVCRFKNNKLYES